MTLYIEGPSTAHVAEHTGRNNSYVSICAQNPLTATHRTVRDSTVHGSPGKRWCSWCQAIVRKEATEVLGGAVTVTPFKSLLSTRVAS